jgi:hypothetical protein
MLDKQAKLGRFCVFVLATAIVALSLSAQQSTHTRIPLVTDWSSRHLIFSAPSTAAKLAEVSRDPRFQQQWLRRNLHPAPPKDGEETGGGASAAIEAFGGKGGWGGIGGGSGSTKGTLKRDWSTSLGPGATVGADTYPAKFSFDTTTASCTNDFVVYGTSVAGAAAGANAAATGTFSSTGPNDGDTATLTYGSGSVATITATAAETASATGTFSANTSTGQTATIGGTLVLHSVPGGQVTFSGEPAVGDTVSVGATTYIFETTCTAGPACVVRSGTTTTQATNLSDAINSTCAVGHGDCDVTSGANTSVTAATSGSSVVTLTSRATPPAAYTLSESAGGTTVATGARGTGSNSGTNFVIGVTNGSSVTTNDAASLAGDIAANGSGVGVTATSTGAVVTVTATTAGTGGNSISLAEGLSSFTWSGATLSGGAAPQTGDNFFAITNATGTALTLGTITSNFATAVTNESADVGVPVTASASGGVATLAPTAAAPGSLGNGVALTESMTNFVWNHGTMTGGVGQASIIAYSNLYSSCGGAVPSVLWSYFTGGTVQTSPVLSLDGKQVAFVQTTGTTANLVLLKWASATVTAGSPVTLTTTTASAYSTCTAPCMLTIAFNGAHNDSNSSVYYDYSGDAIYVGDDNGSLHKFTPIFNGGTPAEFLTSPWPVALTNSAGMQTTGPVYAINNGIYIASARTSNTGTAPGGYLYRVNPTTGAITASAQLSRVPGIVDSPIVDPSAGEVYIFAGTDTSTDCFGEPCNGVFQFGTAFAAAATGTEEEVGDQVFFGTALPIFTGDFDNTYFNSSDPPTGSLYVCGNVGGAVEIFRIPITSNAMGAAVTGPSITSGSASCSPITEADSGTVDTIFVNVQNRGNVGNCTGGGCVMSFTVTSGTLPSGTAPTASLPENGGASGIVIDTLGSGTTGANQVYFTPLTTGGVCPSAAGCAIQASQSGLN